MKLNDFKQLIEADAWGLRHRAVGNPMAREVGPEEGSNKLNNEETLKEALRLLPKYGILKTSDSTFSKFSEYVNSFMKQKNINTAQQKAIEEGLLPWVAALKEVENSTENKKEQGVTGGKEFLSYILDNNVNGIIETLGDQPLRIIGYINETGSLFPEGKNFGKYEGGYLNRLSAKAMKTGKDKLDKISSQLNMMTNIVEKYKKDKPKEKEAPKQISSFGQQWDEIF
jgi:hypothetical protein